MCTQIIDMQNRQRIERYIKRERQRVEPTYTIKSIYKEVIMNAIDIETEKEKYAVSNKLIMTLIQGMVKC